MRVFRSSIGTRISSLVRLRLRKPKPIDLRIPLLQRGGALFRSRELQSDWLEYEPQHSGSLCSWLGCDSKWLFQQRRDARFVHGALQPLEYRSVELRFGHLAVARGPGGHGSVYAPDHWIRCPCGNGRWCRTLSDVQPRHWRAIRVAEVPKLRQRSTVSVSPVASQSAGTGGEGNQDDPLRSPVPFIRGKADRHPSTRISGSHVVLDRGRPRKQAARVQDLLQQPSHTYLTRRANAEYARVTTSRQSPFVSMATALSILISATNGCVIPKTRARCDIRSTSAKLPRNRYLQRASRIPSGHCNRMGSECQTQLTFTARLPIRSAPVTIRQIRDKSYVTDFKGSRSFGAPQVECVSECASTNPPDAPVVR